MDKVIVKHDVGFFERAHGLERKELRVTRPRADEPNLAAPRPIEGSRPYAASLVRLRSETMRRTSGRQDPHCVPHFNAT